MTADQRIAIQNTFAAARRASSDETTFLVAHELARSYTYSGQDLEFCDERLKDAMRGLIALAAAAAAARRRIEQRLPALPGYEEFVAELEDESPFPKF